MNREKSHPIFFLVLFIVTGVALRLNNFANVFYDGAVIFPGFDPYYHMTRIFKTLDQWPHVPNFDAAINFPYGAVIIWPPLFDFSIATLCLAAGLGPDDIYAVETLAAFTSPIIGAVTAIPVYLLSKEILKDTKQALFASALMLLIPVHIWYSLLGFVDQHAAVTLIQATMFYVFVKGSYVIESPGSFAKKVGWLFAGSLSILAGALTWNGYLFYVAILDLFLVAILIIDGRRTGSYLATLLWGTHIPVAVGLSPFVAATVAAGGAPFAAITISWFHVVAIGSAGLFGLLFQVYYSSYVQSLSLVARIAGLFVSVAMVVAPMMLQIDTIAEGLGWVFTKDPFMAQVNESQPIFSSNEGFTFFHVIYGPTVFFILVPVMMLFLAVTAGKEPRERRNILFLLLWSSALFLITLKQRRFSEAFAPSQAILTAGFLFALADHVKKLPLFGKLEEAYKSRLSEGVIFVVVVATFWPFYAPLLRGENTITSGKSAERRVYKQLKKFHATILSEETAPSVKTSTMKYGAINPWDLGHKILYITGLPVVSNNFGIHIGEDSYHDWSAFFLGVDEEEAVKILEKRGIRYVITNNNLPTIYAAMLALGFPIKEYYFVDYSRKKPLIIYKPKYLETVGFRMDNMFGSEESLKNKIGGKLTSIALKRLRHVFDESAKGRQGYFKVYEFVKGAQIRITGEPDELFMMSYKFTTVSGVDVTYRQTVVANKDGVGETVVPYPSDRPDLGFTASYQIKGESGSAKLFVSEDAVVNGEVVPVEVGNK